MNMIEMQDILWCPIDIPKFPIQDFKPAITTSWEKWSFRKLTNPKASAYDISELSMDTISTYPEFSDWIDNFPYKTIRNIKFNIQNSSVHVHTDFTKPEENLELYRNNVENEPCGYRVLLSGKRFASMFVMDGDTKIYTVMPYETDVYILGHTSTYHGVDEEPGRETLFLHIEIDPIKHEELVMRSYDKYKDYAILKQK